MKDSKSIVLTAVMMKRTMLTEICTPTGIKKNMMWPREEFSAEDKDFWLIEKY